MRVYGAERVHRLVGNRSIDTKGGGNPARFSRDYAVDWHRLADRPQADSEHRATKMRSIGMTAGSEAARPPAVTPGIFIGGGGCILPSATLCFRYDQI